MRFFRDATITLTDPRATASGTLFTRAVISYVRDGARRTFTAYPRT